MKIEIEFNKSSVHEHELKMDMIAKVEGTKKELTISAGYTTEAPDDDTVKATLFSTLGRLLFIDKIPSKYK